ncbi:MAG TPA: thrombospondin type 3 repeat-containing protein [bacterium]|nr:thrombospondin type 3 repeat-containing protein [bacterium]
MDTQKTFDNADFDGDGLTNQEEMVLGTNFRKADTDGDGYTDYEEVQAGFDPLTAAQK